MIEASKDNRLIAENLAVHVWLDAKTGRPRSVPDDFRSMVQKYEGTSFANLQPPLMT
jgi:acyl-CoA thioesterase FadM